jgi:hypothetical protein
VPADQLRVIAGIPELPGTVPRSLGSAHSAAAVFSIHSPRGLAGFPTLTIRVWPISSADEVWFVRAPTIAEPTGQETVAPFLVDSIFLLAGPFPAYRQATVEQGLAIIDETSRLFVSIAEHYVRALGDDQDPSRPDTWADRAVQAVDLAHHLPAAASSADTTAPSLVSFLLQPPDGTPAEDPTITVTCRVVDAQSGIGDGGSSSPSQARIRSRSGQFRDVVFTPATRVSGDERVGTYSSSFTLDDHAERGLWSAEYVMLVDNAGNRRDYPPQELAAQGFSTSILVR